MLAHSESYSSVVVLCKVEVAGSHHHRPVQPRHIHTELPYSKLSSGETQGGMKDHKMGASYLPALALGTGYVLCQPLSIPMYCILISCWLTCGGILRRLISRVWYKTLACPCSTLLGNPIQVGAQGLASLGCFGLASSVEKLNCCATVVCSWWD